MIQTITDELKFFFFMRNKTNCLKKGKVAVSKSSKPTRHED